MFTPAELGRILHVNAKTVTRWTVEGRLKAVRTPGGIAVFHRLSFSR